MSFGGGDAQQHQHQQYARVGYEMGADIALIFIYNSQAWLSICRILISSRYRLRLIEPDYFANFCKYCHMVEIYGAQSGKIKQLLLVCECVGVRICWMFVCRVVPIIHVR